MTRRYSHWLISSSLLFFVAGIAWVLRDGFSQKRPQDSPVQSQSHGKESSTVIRAVPARLRQGDSGVSPRSKSPSPFFFSEAIGDSGIDFHHESGTSEEKPFPSANGSGVASLDYDLDGFYDLYFLTGTPFPIDSGRGIPINRFYRNKGDWQFEDITHQIGLGHNGYSAGVAVGDYDADGFPDVYVTCYGENCLYHNQGDGTFIERGKISGVADRRWATSAAFLDFDSDGLLDLYVCNYGRWSLETNQFCGDRERNVRIHCSPHTVPPERDVFYQNLGNGTFRDVTEPTGLANRAGRAQGVIAADFNEDGLIDLYIGNDLHANSLFLNEGNGHFQDAMEISGVAYDYLGHLQAGMGVDAADVNADGRLDLFVTNFENEHNAFYENLGNGFFQELSHARGLAADSMPWVGWGTVFADFDLDGWADVFVTNGHTDDNLHKLGRDSQHAQPPLIWHNVNGRFIGVRESAGTYFAQDHVGRGLALVDLDNDGDHDLVVVHQDSSPALLRNEHLSPSAGGRDKVFVPRSSASQSAANRGFADSTPATRPCVRLRLIGTRSNRDAVGSKITLKTESRTVVQQIKGGGSYLSAHDLRQVFAIHPDEAQISIEIRWPAGNQSMLTDLQPGESYLVIEPVQANAAPQLIPWTSSLILQESPK